MRAPRENQPREALFAIGNPPAASQALGAWAHSINVVVLQDCVPFENFHGRYVRPERSNFDARGKRRSRSHLVERIPEGNARGLQRILLRKRIEGGESKVPG